MLAAVARHVGGSRPTAADREAALQTVVDYVLFRVVRADGHVTQMLRTTIANAVRGK